MAQDTRERSCDERLPEHREGRLRDFRDFALVQDADGARDGTLAQNVLDAADRLEIELDPDATGTDLYDAATERMHEYPLGVSSYRTFRVDLSTGGPGDWLEVECTGDTPNYDPAGDGEHYEIERITYHFNDWFDHAEDTLAGDDFDVAARFVSQVVPELID